MAIKREPYSYRGDRSVADFPDDRAIIVFDGYCVLCSGWARFVMRHDPQATYRLLAAQSPLGDALYRHYGLDPADYETHILIADGIAWFEAEGAIRVFEGLGPPWSLARIFRVVPRALRDKMYRYIATNRFRLFGRRETCFVAAPEMKERFLA